MKEAKFSRLGNYQISLGNFSNSIRWVLTFLLGISLTASAQRSSDFFREVRSIETTSFNIQKPTGVAFSPAANAFIIFEASTVGQDVSDILLIDQLGDDQTGSVTIGIAISDSINIAFDSNTNRLLMLQSDGNTLFIVNAGSNGVPGTTPSETIPTDQFGLENPQGIAVDSTNGDIFILDSSGPRILRIIPGPNGDLSSASISELDLSNSGLEDLRGMALNPVSGNFQIMDPVRQRLYEVNQKGVIVANHNLSILGAFTPQGIAYAPSGDRTDDASKMNLYIAADNGVDGQILELTLTQARTSANSAHTSATLVQGTLIRSTDASGFDPPSPDSSGIAYNTVTETLFIVDGEVNEIVSDSPPPQIPLFDDANVFVMTPTGTLSTTFNISTIMTDGQDPPGEDPPGTLILFPNPDGFTNEPTGITYDAGNNVFYISDDQADEVWRVNPTDMSLLDSFDVRSFSTDPEGITFNPTDGNLYIAGGFDDEVYRIDPGANGIFDGVSPAGDDQVTSFDTTSLGINDPEGISFDPNTGHLFIVGAPNTEMGHVSTSGVLVRMIDISDANTDKPAGLVVAPRSTNPSLLSVYIADRGKDNNSVPGENDGMVFEFSVPPISGGNMAPNVNAGSDQMVILPSLANLNGTVTDDGLPIGMVDILWSKVSGPGTVSFGNDTLEDTTASFSMAGIYTLRLTADDSELASSDDVVIDVTASNGGNILEVPIATSSDDAEERGASLSVLLNSSDLEMVFDGTTQQSVGLRFAGITIPNGATITNAYVQFQADEVTTDAANLTITGEAVDDASTFISTSGNITSRSLTTASVGWSPAPWPTIGEASFAQQTPNIAPIIQEIVNRPGWASGNALVVIVTGGNGVRTAESFEGSTAPLLHIEFTPSGGNQSPSVSITSPADGSTFTDGDSISFAGTATDPEDGDVSSSLVWTSNLSGQIGTGASFTTLLTIGTHTITAIAMDSASQSGTDQITVIVNSGVNQPPSVAINTPPNNSTFGENNSITFTATATDPEDGDVSSSLVWTSNLSGQIGTGASFSTPLAIGTHTITATAMDSLPQSGSDQITITVSMGNGPIILDVPITASSDDAEERGGALSMSLTSSDLELVDDGSREQTVGLRFTGITIPNGATIVNAYVQFQVDEVDSGTASLTIHGEDNDNAGTFTSVNGNISSRTLTATSVGWSPVDWTTVGEAGVDQRTPDIASVIQEIVDRIGWVSGNSLAIIIGGTGERTSESFDGSQAPSLHVEYLQEIPSPSLEIMKTATPTSYSAVGDVIVYSYAVSANGNVGIDGPIVIDDDITTDENCPALSTVGNGDGVLDPGETVTCTSSHSIVQADLDSGSVTNVASASGTFNGNTVTSPTDTEIVTANQAAALAMVKTATPLTYSSAGDIISYSYEVSVSGNVGIDGPIVIDDDITTDENCPALSTVGNGDGVLDPGETVTCTSSHSIVQADLDSGSVTNVASASGTFNGNTVTSPTDTEIVTANQAAALAMVKTATPLTYSSVGDIISYSYEVSVSGNVGIDGPIVIDDDITTDENCPALSTVGNGDGVLDPGETVTCTSSHSIVQADLDSGSVTNVATASGTSNGNVVISPTDTETVFLASASLAMVKTATPLTYLSVGDVISYSYEVSVSGNVGIDGPIVIDDDITTDENCPALSTVGNGDGVLDPGETVTCTSSHSIVQNDLDSGSVTNVASASGTFNGNAVTSPTDTETVFLASASLAMVKTATPLTYSSVGDIISYSYEVSVSGNVGIDGPIVIDDDITTDENCPALSTVGNGDGILDPGETVTCTSSYNIVQADLDSGSVTNVASASGTFDGNAVTSPTDTETVTANQAAALAMVKTATPLTYSSVGDIISYSYEVSVSGNVGIDGPIVIDDDITLDESCPALSTVGNGDGVLDSGETVTCTSSHNIVQADLDSGSVTNVASASGTFNGNAVTSPTDTETVTAAVAQVVEVQISESSDDAEQRSTLAMSLTSSDLELVDDGSREQIVGLRFNGIAISNGAIITNAYVQFQADEVDSDVALIEIQGQDTDNATTFTSASGNISSRTLTTASVGWNPPPWNIVGAAGLDQRTPNIASVIQEIVNRAGWASGNSLAIIFNGSGERTAESFDGSQAPLLHIEFTTSGGNQPPTVTITSPSNGSTFTEGNSISFGATATDPEDGDVSDSLVWSSNIDGQIGTGSSFSTTALSVGSHTITAMAMDAHGLPGSDMISITVNLAENQPPTVTITSPSNDSTFTEGNSISFGATAIDPEDGDVSGSLVWSSSIDGQIGTGSSFSTAVLSVGTHTITATAMDTQSLPGSDMISITVDSSGGLIILDIPISADTDDAEERQNSSLSMFLGSNDLDLVDDGSNNQKVGLRFADLSIPNGATIVNAYIQFQADEADSGFAQIMIQGEDTDNAATFVSTGGNISGRTLFGPIVTWEPPDWPTVGAASPDQRTSDIAPILQAIVNRAGWASGNALAIMFSGTGERTAESFDGSQAPVLHVEYITP